MWNGSVLENVKVVADSIVPVFPVANLYVAILVNSDRFSVPLIIFVQLSDQNLFKVWIKEVLDLCGAPFAEAYEIARIQLSLLLKGSDSLS